MPNNPTSDESVTNVAGQSLTEEFMATQGMKSLIPTFNVEDLFNEYSTSVPQNADKADAEPSEHILAAVMLVLNSTSIYEARDLAKQLNVPDRKLSAAVELLTGLSLAKFIQEWRFLQSQLLLRNTELPYNEVANRCGFADEHNLIRLYQRRLKTTPHTFRTGYRIRNTNYKHNRNGYSSVLNGQNRGAKNKVYSKQ